MRSASEDKHDPENTETNGNGDAHDQEPELQEMKEGDLHPLPFRDPEMRRVLSPEGFSVVAFIERESPLGEYYRKTREKSRFLSLATFHTRDEISGYLIRAGFCRPLTCSLSQGFSVIVARPDR